MALKPPRKGLRVFINQHDVLKVDLRVPGGADLVVPLDVANQLVALTTHAEVNAEDRVAAEAEAAEIAAREAAEADASLQGDGTPSPTDSEQAPARKAPAAKKAAAKKDPAATEE